MAKPTAKTTCYSRAGRCPAVLGLGLVLVLTAAAQDRPSVTDAARCTVDLSRPGTMKDIVSNALHQGLQYPEADVAAFLHDAHSRFDTGQTLLKAAAAHFKVTETRLRAVVEKYKHCNCRHGLTPEAMTSAAGGKNDRPQPLAPRSAPARGTRQRVSQFARDVTLHVVLHELGHAVIREFDLPILGNEETAADAFATCYLTTHMPDRAVDVLKGRVQSLMIEARAIPRQEWTVKGEHNSDARRAYQIAALAVAADAEKYKPVASAAGMTVQDMRKARDYGTEIHRSWRRVLQPVRMPAGTASREARVRYETGSRFLDELCSTGLAKEIESVVRSFDWHSQVTVLFVEGDGGAGWSRSKRTVTVNSEYVRRFIRQGQVRKTQ